VSIDDLGLADDEKKVFKYLVGSRFNSATKIVKLTSAKFPNRIENKRHLIFLLENLVQEARRLNSNKAELS
jgi:hypothetical protein